MRISERVKSFSILLCTVLAGSLLTPPPANAAYTVLPKVGQCFQYTKAQVSAKYPSKNPVRCSSTHNMETYVVATWPVETNPVDMDRELTLNIVDELCNFWGNFPKASSNRLRTSSFNYWAWYTPSRSAWANGQRWLRCDAMIGKFSSAEEWPPATYISWKGSKLTSYF